MEKRIQIGPKNLQDHPSTNSSGGQIEGQVFEDRQVIVNFVARKGKKSRGSDYNILHGIMHTKTGSCSRFSTPFNKQ